MIRIDPNMRIGDEEYLGSGVLIFIHRKLFKLWVWCNNRFSKNQKTFQDQLDGFKPTKKYESNPYIYKGFIKKTFLSRFQKLVQGICYFFMIRMVVFKEKDGTYTYRQMKRKYGTL